jgi:DNA transformation protein
LAISEDYLEYLKGQLEWLPHLRAKRMFGGAGFYSDGLFFAIADDNGLYLKGDPQSEHFYRAQSSERFAYESKGKVSRMNFWSVNADALEDEEVLRRWVEVALETAQRATG